MTTHDLLIGFVVILVVIFALHGAWVLVDILFGGDDE